MSDMCLSLRKRDEDMRQNSASGVNQKSSSHFDQMNLVAPRLLPTAGSTLQGEKQSGQPSVSADTRRRAYCLSPTMMLYVLSEGLVSLR